MNRRHRCPSFEMLETRALLSTISWIGGNPSDPAHTDPALWSNPGNWIGGQVPGTGDTASFDANTSVVGSGGTTYHATTTVTLNVTTVIVGLQIAGNWGGTIFVGVGTGSPPYNSLTLTGASTWSSGTIAGNDAGGVDTLVNQGSITISGAATKTLGGTNGLTLNNSGTISYSGGQLTCTNATLNNLASGLFDFTGNSSLTGGGSKFNNFGTVRKSAGTSVSSFSFPFNNQGGTPPGAIDVRSGSLRLGGGTSTGGAFTVASGTMLVIAEDTAAVVWTGTYSGSGAGSIQLSNNLHIGTAGATLNFSGGLFQWTAGTITGIDPSSADVLTIASGSTITISGTGNKVFGGPTTTTGDTHGITVQNFGTIAQPSGGIQFIDTKFTNNAGAVWDFQADNTSLGGTGATQFNNAGTVRKSAGTLGPTPVGSDFGWLINNTGTVEAKAGFLGFYGNVAQISGNELTGGTWNVFSGGALYLSSDIKINSANVTLSGATPIFYDLQNLNTNNGSLSLLNGCDIETAGQFTNNGTVTIGPGSVATIPGNLTLGATGVVNEQIGGTPASLLFGQVKVTSGGVAQFGGTLTTAYVNGFIPGSDQNYKAVTFPSRVGTFATVTGPATPGKMVPAYHTGDVTLTLNRSPIAYANMVSTLPDFPVVIRPLANDFDVEGDAISLLSIGTPAHGGAVINADNSVTYTPMPGFSGTDKFQYTVQDAVGNTVSAVLAVSVTTTIWHNELYPCDVTGDGFIVAEDVVVIINWINARGAGKIISTATGAPPFLDVKEDGEAIAEDVVTVINYINARGAGPVFPPLTVDGQTGATSLSMSESALILTTNLGETSAIDDIILLLAQDIADPSTRRRLLPGWLPPRETANGS